MSLEQRIDDLESRLAFQDDTLQTLNEVVFAQQQAIERLEMQLQALAKRQAEVLGQLGGADQEEAPPPHY
ncbi:SlyX family protein [Pseudomonas mangrovi]|jgi:SlyX protein|uniref:Protein SlyX homolog n=1 Tax=Pseudomonas mangrovi TaxID=2161748 RepID=A0A2T5P4W3_9PSED|nr:SlyX family protein [Pseudomonas mangrovi]PTU72765.1 hypothetical protein DBO85_18610 [Pseudomonas mangrovi]